MLNPDTKSPSENKSKRKNDADAEALHKRHKFIRGMLVAAISASLAILYVLHWSQRILDGSTAPVIDRVEYHREYIRNEANTGGEVRIHLSIYYHDIEGDVSTVEIEAGRTGANWSWIHSGEENASPFQQRWGAVRTTWFECAGSGLDLTINFIDQLGNRSNTIKETIPCYVPEIIPTVQFQARGTSTAEAQE